MESLINNRNHVEDNVHDIKKQMNIVFSKLEKDKKKRSCLMCGKMFNSNGPHNRRCRACDHLTSHHEYFQPSSYRSYSKKTESVGAW